MTLNPNHGRSTGRAARIRQFLANNPGEWTARQIAEGIGEESGTPVSSALNVMARRNYVRRVGFGHGVRWRMGHVSVPEVRTGGIDIVAPRTAQGRGPLPRAQDLARVELAADLAAFEAAGGTIQRLGVTRLFADPLPAANQPIPAPRSRAGRRRSSGSSL